MTVALQETSRDQAVETALALRHLYIAWVKFQRRPLSMQSYVGYKLVHLPPREGKLAKALGYFAQAFDTVRLIHREQPDVVWFQSPPSFIAHILAILRVVSGRKFKIVADCHNGALDPRLHKGVWANFPGVIGVLNGFEVVIAHNDAVREIAASRGVDRERLITLETRPAPLPIVDTPARPERPVVLVPCSFQDDEPIEALLQAAASLPHVSFKLTGNKTRAIARGYDTRTPPNVELTGFLSGEDYTHLLTHADIVLGLTTVEGIQLSAANEAVGAGRPMVLSDTRLLRDLFGDAALFSGNDAESLAATLQGALEQLPQLAGASRALKAKREARWQGQVNSCLRRLV